MVGTMSLLRIEARSMYGLVSFLCTRYQNLNLHEAMRCLLEADANLLFADPNLDSAAAAVRIGQRQHGCGLQGRPELYDALSKVEQQAPFTSVQEAFNAAAAAARHPNPDAQGDLLSSLNPLLSAALLLLQNHEQLSSEDVHCLASLLSTEGMLLQQQPAPSKQKKLSGAVKRTIHEWMYQHARISTKVKAALAAYALQNGEPMYELHVICGVNDAVSGPEYCSKSRRQTPFIYHHTHLNFLASRSIDQCAGRAPVLFFAELSNDEDDEGSLMPLCCPVSFSLPCTEQIRCLYCDHEGIRIVHPAVGGFHGRELEFEKMVCEEDVYKTDFDQKFPEIFYTNEGIISYSDLIACHVVGLDEDCIYSKFASSDDDTDEEDNSCDDDTDEEDNSCDDDTDEEDDSDDYVIGLDLDFDFD